MNKKTNVTLGLFFCTIFNSAAFAAPCENAAIEKAMKITGQPSNVKFVPYTNIDTKTFRGSFHEYIFFTQANWDANASKIQNGDLSSASAFIDVLENKDIGTCKIVDQEIGDGNV